MNIQGNEITKSLHNFNNWRDDFLIELSTLLLMLGFLMGTVDIYTRGGLATNTWFSVSWAVVQAVSIDGLFFAVWGKIARSTWTREQLGRNIAMVCVGMVLALVAVLVNDILSFQQVRNVSDSVSAMTQLHIDSSLFTHTRAVLVVAVAILVSLFCRGKHTAVQVVNAPVEVNETPVQHNETPLVCEEGVHPEEVEQEEEHQDTVQDETSLITWENGKVATVQFPGKEVVHRSTDTIHLVPTSLEEHPQNSTEQNVQRVKDILDEEPRISVRKLAQRLEVPPSTANNWLKRAKSQQQTA